MSTPPPHGEWLRGVLGLCVLRTLADGPTYGYAIATTLAEAGLGDVKGGTLYPLLGRLESAGLVTVEWRAGDGGPGRKYVTLTAEGRAELTAGTSQWAAFSATVGAHLSGGTSLTTSAGPARADRSTR